MIMLDPIAVATEPNGVVTASRHEQMFSGRDYVRLSVADTAGGVDRLVLDITGTQAMQLLADLRQIQVDHYAQMADRAEALR